MGIQIARHKTAISRSELSNPVRRALEDGLISGATEVFDYGCGLGDDVRLLRDRGITAGGWDPVHRKDSPRTAADVVNLGFVVNTIEDAGERVEVLRSAWALARRLLIVSGRLRHEQAKVKAQPHLDGCLTEGNTFQKFFDQSELRAWIDSSLGLASVAAGPGVFYVFRDSELQQTFAASRFRRPVAAPRVRRSDELLEKHRPLFDAFMGFMARRGRRPDERELAEAGPLREAVGGLKRAEYIVRLATGAEQWEAIRRERAQELLIYLALARFGGRPSFRELPFDLQLDVRAFFAHYANACQEADGLLFSAGDMKSVDHACGHSPVGKPTPEALYVHVSALSYLPPILRVYEGCARHHLGVVDAANVVKLHRSKPQISYLLYPGFDREAHPALAYSLVFSLQALKLEHRDYTACDNPFILHRKEEFVAGDYPGRAKFAALTKKEESFGLYQSPELIGTRGGWGAELDRVGVRIEGHLVRKAPKRSQRDAGRRARPPAADRRGG